MGWNEIDRAASIVRRTPIHYSQAPALPRAPRLSGRAGSMLGVIIACATFATLGAGLGATIAADPPAIIPVAEASPTVLSVRFEHEADAELFWTEADGERDEVCLTELPQERSHRWWVHSC